MTMQTLGLQPGRINRFKGEILKHAVPLEVLSRQGRQVRYPKNSGDTYIARRFLPWNSTAANPNQFFQNGAGDRALSIVQQHQVQEGVTPLPDSIVAQDIPVVMQQYSCLYGFTDRVADLHEDDIPEAMTQQVGERVTLVNELICYGAIKASTNQYFGGTGTSLGTVNGGISLPLIRKITRNLQANHGRPVTSMLKASGNYGTDAVAAGYFVYSHTDLEPDIRDLPGFVPVEKYATGQAVPNEIGKVERFRFVTSPEFPSRQDAGAAVASTGLQSTSGANIDVYSFIVTAADAWSQVSIRGLDALDPTYLRPGEKTKSDPHGQRGYIGTIWYKAVMVENNGWLAVGNVGLKAL